MFAAAAAGFEGTPQTADRKPGESEAGRERVGGERDGKTIHGQMNSGMDIL